ncbi:class E sortase [Pseudactinotalea sp.]|uniref:class E sortase n=1 Tax=Pseudactinotalea sp. TaxID=1926260 RepID=UPI003B3A6EEB
MGRPAEPRAAGADGTGRGRLARRIVVGMAAVAAATVLVLAPGWGTQPSTPLERMLDAAAGADSHRPTLQTVQDLAAQLSESSGDQPVDPDRVAAVVTQPGDYAALGILEVPAIGLDVEFGNGVDPVTLALGPGHWTGTPLPGQLGNAVISGHRTTHTAPFRDLDELAAGDEITVTSLAGVGTTYVVTDVLVVPVAQYEREVLAQPAEAGLRELTLFACHPEGSLTHRIVVHAQAESS